MNSCWAYFTQNLVDRFSARNVDQFSVDKYMMLFARIMQGQPKSFATQFKYYGTCTVVVTLITVLVFLGPTIGYKKMFEGNNLYMHLVGPLLALISFCFLDRGTKLNISHVWKSLIPTIIYGAVYIVMVLITKEWPDFYGFNANGMWYVSLVAMMAGAFIIGLVIKALHNDK